MPPTDAVQCPTISLLLLRPVFHRQARYAAESGIVADQNRTYAVGVGSDEHIRRREAAAFGLDFGTELSVMGGFLFCESLPPFALPVLSEKLGMRA